MLTLLLSVLVICVHSRGGGRGGGGGGRGGGFGRGGGGFRSSSRGGVRSSYSGYKAKKSGGTLKKAAAIGATAFVGYQVSFIVMGNARRLAAREGLVSYVHDFNPV